MTHAHSDEHLPRLFQPLPILPEQFFTAKRRWRCLNGETRLMAAILEDAITVYLATPRGGSAKQQRLLLSTERWLFNNDKKWVFSFLRVCEALDICSLTVRRMLRERRAAMDHVPSKPAAATAAAERHEPCRLAG